MLFRDIPHVFKPELAECLSGIKQAELAPVNIKRRLRNGPLLQHQAEHILRHMGLKSGQTRKVTLDPCRLEVEHRTEFPRFFALYFCIGSI